jgi:hypothetical protein
MTTIKRETRRASSKFREFTAVTGNRPPNVTAKTGLGPWGQSFESDGVKPGFSVKTQASRVTITRSVFCRNFEKLALDFEKG